MFKICWLFDIYILLNAHNLGAHCKIITLTMLTDIASLYLPIYMLVMRKLQSYSTSCSFTLLINYVPRIVLHSRTHTLIHWQFVHHLINLSPISLCSLILVITILCFMLYTWLFINSKYKRGHALFVFSCYLISCSAKSFWLKFACVYTSVSLLSWAYLLFWHFLEF